MDIYRNIVCASDFSAAAERAIVRAGALSLALGARLTLLHVMEHYPEDLPSREPVAENEDPDEVFRARALEQLEQSGAAAGVPFDTEVLLSRRSATRAVLEYLDLHGSDLLVVGTAEHPLLGVLGSSAAALASRAPCDVLVIR